MATILDVMGGGERGLGILILRLRFWDFGGIWEHYYFLEMSSK